MKVRSKHKHIGPFTKLSLFTFSNKYLHYLHESFIFHPVVLWPALSACRYRGGLGSSGLCSLDLHGDLIQVLYKDLDLTKKHDNQAGKQHPDSMTVEGFPV